MNTGHNNAAAIAVDIAKGWRPNYYLTNMAMSYFQAPGMNVAPSIFPILPVHASTGSYYIFNKEEIAKDQVKRKPKFGAVDPAVFSHSDDTYKCEVDQIIVGVDNITALDYQRTGAPATIDPRRAKVKQVSEQMNLHLDMVFANKFFNADAWANVKTGEATASTSKQFVHFDDANADIVGQFDEMKKEILLNGRRMPNKLCLGYRAYKAIKNHPQFLERVTGSGSTPNPALVNEQVIAAVLGLEEVKVLYATYNAAEIGQKADMKFVFDDNSALLTYAPKEVDLEEPSAGYIYTWDMLGNGQWMATSQYDGPGGSHSEFIEGLMATDMKKTSDDLATFLSGCVSESEVLYMNYVALKPVNFGGKQYKIGETIPEGVVDERRSLFLKKSGHIAEVASVNGAYAEDLNVNPNTLSIPLLQSKHELAVNAQQLLQFFATIQKTMEEAKIEIATMTEEDTPVLQLLHEIDSRKGIKAAVETRLADLSNDADINQESEAVEETEEPAEQPEGGEENDV